MEKSTKEVGEEERLAMEGESPSDIRELSSEEDWRQAWEVLCQLRPYLELEYFLTMRRDLQNRGYRLFGLFSCSRIVCVAGILIHPHVSRERDFWVHDLVTMEDERSKGHGKNIMRFLEDLAREAGCTRLSVHTRVSRKDAQRFYENKLDYQQYAIVYEKDLTPLL